MRVVAGRFKGQRLSAPQGADVRPTSDRAREALFSMLGPLDGERVLDLYAGSGALGIEALSRGALSTTFVDSAPVALDSVRSNLERLGVEGEASLFRSDAAAFLRGAARHADRWDLVFCDPPYNLAHRLADDLGRLLPPVLAPGARIVCESSEKDSLTLALPVLKQRRYGGTVIVIHQYGGQDAP